MGVKTVKEEIEKIKRCRIGFQTFNLYDEYAYSMIRGASDYLKEHDIDLILFPGETFNSPQDFMYQSNSVFELINISNIDALITTTGTLTHNARLSDVQDKISRFQLPVVSIGERLEGCSNVLVENYNGMRRIIEHLVHEHRYTRIAFIKGPKHSTEARERFQAYLDVLSENQIPFREELVAEGGFFLTSGRQAVRDLILKRRETFEAVAAANDSMAMGAIEELNALGYHVPRDIAVTGFDGIESCQYAIPSLTTAQQPFYLISRKAAELAVEHLSGKQTTETVVLPTDLIIRSSCSCISGAALKRPIPDAALFHNGTLFSSSPGNKEWLHHLDIELLISDFPEPRKKTMHASILQILGIFQENEISRKECQEFLVRLSDVWQDEVRQGYNIEIWERIMQTVFHVIEGQYTRRESRAMLSFLQEKTYSLYSEICQAYQVMNRKNLESRIYQIREAVQNIASSLNRDQLSDILLRVLPLFGLNHCYIVSYRKMVRYPKGKKWRMPKKLELFITCRGLKMCYEENKIFNSDVILPESVMEECRGLPLIVYPLYFMEEQFGYVIFDYIQLERGIYEILSAQISSAMKISHLFLYQEKVQLSLKMANRELQKYNVQLQKISIRDELTGLFNRRGFLQLAGKSMLIAREMEINGALVFFDLDRLKLINDRFGHHEGDIALRAASDILKKTFRRSDIIARLGGDEFTVICIDIPDRFLDNLQFRLKKNLMEWNRNSGKEYLLGLSLGIVPFSSSNLNSLEDMMKMADDLLYQQKKEKKKAEKIAMTAVKK